MFVFLVGWAALLSACQKDVEKKRVEEAAAWATSMCDCAKKSGAEAKTCAAALAEPADPGAETGIGSQPKYRVESLKAYIGIISPGEECERKIKRQAKTP
jgi:hypothetical protein